jgi:hypothetical protein
MSAKAACHLALLALLACPGAATAQTLDQSHGLLGTARYDAGLYTAYCPRDTARPAKGPVPMSRGVRAAAPDGEAPVAADAEASGAGGGETPGPVVPSQAGSSDEEAPGASEEEDPIGDEPTARAASTSEAGWPAKQCLKMDKGSAGHGHTLVGLDGVHNWLLGGYGNDTIIGGNRGDVIWADYHPSGEPRSQTAFIRAGDGRNVIYANDTRDYVWTGTNPGTVVHAHVSGISGVIHCQSPGIVVYLSTVSERHFTLDGCRHISHYSVGY